MIFSWNEYYITGILASRGKKSSIKHALLSMILFSMLIVCYMHLAGHSWNMDMLIF